MKGCEICSEKCMGFNNNHGGCCTVGDRNFIIGPHNDTEEFLKCLNNKFGRIFKFDEIFYSFDVGKEIFPDKPIWQNETSYPALKIDLNNSLNPCIFYNMTLKCCTIYDIRPNTCEKYECDYLKNNKI